MLVLAGYAGFTMTRELRLFETDMLHDHSVLGRALSSSAELVWDSSGVDEAIRMVAVTNAHEDLIVRWRPAAEHEGTTELHLHVKRGQKPALASFYPVRHAGKVAGWIEINESMRSRDTYMRTSAVTTLATTGVIALLSTVLAGFLGLTLVGRPVRALTRQAQRVGQGDLSVRVDAARHDELGDLGRECCRSNHRFRRTPCRA